MNQEEADQDVVDEVSEEVDFRGPEVCLRHTGSIFKIECHKW